MKVFNSSFDIFILNIWNNCSLLIFRQICFLFFLCFFSLALYSETAEKLYSQASEGELQKNKQLLELIIQQYPDSKYKVKSLFKLGEIYFLETKYNDAENCFSEILLNHKNSNEYKETLFRINEVLFLQNRNAEAEKYLARYLAEFPEVQKDILFNIKIAGLFYSKGDMANALKYYLKSLLIKPENENKSWIFFQLGNCYNQARQYNEAYISYMTVIKFFPDSAEYEQAQDMIVKLKQNGTLPDYKTTAVEEAAYSYFIQAGAFKKKDNALSLVKDISGNTKKNTEYKLVKLVQEDDFFKVRIGNFFSFEEANNYKKKYRINGFILTE